MLVGPLVPIASCQIAVAPGGGGVAASAWRGNVWLVSLLLLDLGFAGFRLAWGDVVPVCVDSKREVLASGSSLLGEVWAQSPWLSAAPLRLLNLLLTAGNEEGGRRCSSLVWGLDAGLLSFRKSAFTLRPLPQLLGNESHLEADQVVFLGSSDTRLGFKKYI